MSTSRSEFLKKIDEYGTALEAVSSFKKSDKPFGYFEDEQKDYNIYELFCYVTIVHDLSKKHKIKFVKGTNGCFPKGPAKKKDEWNRFDIYEDDTCKYQICAGTRIKCKKSTNMGHSPDISFQRHDAGNTPTEEDVLLIMDAKYTASRKKRLSQTEIIKFIGIVYMFDIKDARLKTDLNFDKLIHLGNNCLLTNAKSSKHDSVYLETEGIRQIENFDENYEEKVKCYA